MIKAVPVLVGVGEVSERIDASDYAALSPADLAASAARAALEDALSADRLAPRIDTIAAIRQFENSTPVAKAPFGRSDNFPRSVAKRIGADPAHAILEVTGGQGPQHLVNELAHAIAGGSVGMALICGAEAISTVRHLETKGETRDWSEAIGGEIEDRGFGLEGLLTGDLIRHGARTPIQLYALFETARRIGLGLDRDAYALEMGRLFAPFTRVAADNPHAMSRDILTAEELAEVTPKNRMLADPFPRRVVARDQANQGAAVLLTSERRAAELGIAREKWIYLHGGADSRERIVMERQDLARNPAAILAIRHALSAAETDLSRIELFDFYSCFPIAVFNVTDAFGLSADDPRGLTVTGGLPFFGGAGNNYSMHAIAAMARRLRRRPGALGLVGANGGFLSKYSVGIYSTARRDWTGFDSGAIQQDVENWPAPELVEAPAGGARLETYTIDFDKPDPRPLIIGRDTANRRFVAMAGSPELAAAMAARDMAHADLEVGQNEAGKNVVTAIHPA